MSYVKASSLFEEINFIFKYAEHSNIEIGIFDFLKKNANEISKELNDPDSIWGYIDTTKDAANVIIESIDNYKKFIDSDPKFGENEKKFLMEKLESPEKIKNIQDLLNDLIMIKRLGGQLNNLISQGPSVTIDILNVIKSIRDLIVKDIQVSDKKKKIISYFEGYNSVISLLIYSIPNNSPKSVAKTIDGEIVRIKTFYKSIAKIGQKCQSILLSFIDPIKLDSFLSQPSQLHTQLSPERQFQKAIDNAFKSTFEISPSPIEYALTTSESSHPEIGRNIRYDRYFHTLSSGGNKWQAKNIADQLSPTLIEKIELTNNEEKKKTNAINNLFSEEICPTNESLYQLYDKLRLYSEITGDNELFIAFSNFIRSVNRLLHLSFNRGDKVDERLEGQELLIKQKEKLKTILRLKINGETLNWLKNHIIVLDPSGQPKAMKHEGPDKVLSAVLLGSLMSGKTTSASNKYNNYIKYIDKEISSLLA